MLEKLEHLSPERLAEIPADKPVVVQCQTGNRSAIGASILQANGFKQVINLLGGIRDWEKAGLPVERNGEVKEPAVAA
jgi:hydroxyacylglutathione hydrolase